MLRWTNYFASLSFSFFSVGGLTSHAPLRILYTGRLARNPRESCGCPKVPFPFGAVDQRVLQESRRRAAGATAGPPNSRGLVFSLLCPDGCPREEPSTLPGLFLCPPHDPELSDQVASQKDTW